jgi:hypothetical protein
LRARCAAMEGLRQALAADVAVRKCEGPGLSRGLVALPQSRGRQTTWPLRVPPAVETMGGADLDGASAGIAWAA